jgi:hypothetical protein
MGTVKGKPGQGYQTSSGRRYTADDVTGLIQNVGGDDRWDLLHLGCDPVPPPSPEVRGDTEVSDHDVLGFVDDYMRSTDHPSQRGLLQRRTERKFPATDRRLMAAARDCGIRGSRGRSRKITPR